MRNQFRLSNVISLMSLLSLIIIITDSKFPGWVKRMISKKPKGAAPQGPIIYVEICSSLFLFPTPLPCVNTSNHVRWIRLSSKPRFNPSTEKVDFKKRLIFNMAKKDKNKNKNKKQIWIDILFSEADILIFVIIFFFTSDNETNITKSIFVCLVRFRD